MLANANGGRNIEVLANRFGLSGEQTQSVQKNASSEGGAKVLNGAGAVEEGNGILGHLLGGKDASRSLSR